MTGISRRGMIEAGGGALAAGAVLAATLAGDSKPPAANSLAGKSMLVTGCSSGFGMLGAQLYARLGAKVFATKRNLPRPEGEALVRLAKDEKLDLTVLELDVLSDDMVTSAIAEAERLAGGPLDILVNNAGISIGGSVELQDIAATRLMFETNVYGYLRAIRVVLPGMRSRKSGLIVNVSSNRGRIVVPDLGLYSATKFAVESMCEQLAYELVPFGIEVVIVEPGGFPTGIGQHSAALSQALADRLEDRHASGYPALVRQMQSPPAGGAAPNLPDPMMVPQAIAEIAAMPAGQRQLRHAVHPSPQPQLQINQVSREAQIRWLSKLTYGEAALAVYD